ncbi:unnamed protein product [Rotaria sordida]|uniref:[histone H3]-lysine(27) N-trimethyltransferase n=1 Tax=Rotaria sordida TaxID=392033 RepID=A0A814W5V2_9BILA|nr:unnamed protein product [Rotaria sordida]CAF1467088.1 unnamed protein product [Rotaria sordida]
MRESRRSNDLSQQQASTDKDDALRQAVEHEYTTLYRQIHKVAQKTARHILRHVAQSCPPRPITIPIPISTIESNTDIDDDNKTVSVIVTDGTNKNLQKNSTIPTVMPTLPIVRELISYVPTSKNVATRGHLIGIPYLGDKFDAEDQRLINSISLEPSKQQKLIRKKKLDEQSLENLFQSFRTNKLWSVYSNEQIIDAILYYHRDSTPRTRLMALANQNDCGLNDKQQHDKSIKKYDSEDDDIDELIIKRWCSQFCPRCYSYNCLLHKEGPSHLPLPKLFSISYDNQSEPCSSICYKYQREHYHNKRSLSPSSYTNQPSDQIENHKKRQRKSSSSSSSSSNKILLNTNENLNIPFNDTQRKYSLQCLTRIENHFICQSIQQYSLLEYNSILNNKNFFRLFYFMFDGDLCLLNQLFNNNNNNNNLTCYDLYQQFINDSKYFSQHLSLTKGLPFSIRQPYRKRMPEGTTRTFLNYVKKYLNRTNSTNGKHTTATTLKPSYQPCLHDGPCTPENLQCCCIKMGTFCEKFCNCSIDCPRRFPGCACKGSCLFNNCLCSAEGRECDPDLCHNCGASLFFNQFNPSVKSEIEIPITREDEKALATASVRNARSRTTSNVPTRSHSLRSCRINEPSYKITCYQRRRTNSRTSFNLNTPQTSSMTTCANITLQRKIHKQILVAESDIAGYGAFLGSPIAYPGDLIAEYTGEIISEEEADRRGRLYDKRACSYLFNLDMQHCIDARQFGNKLRFANHSSKPNCVPKIKLVNGDYRIGIYAKEVIFQGDELFFEYMYDAHHRQQFVNNERVDEEEQENLKILTRYAENFMLVQPSYD